MPSDPEDDEPMDSSAPEADMRDPYDGIDLRALAEKVVGLMKRDLRIERERLGRHEG